MSCNIRQDEISHDKHKGYQVGVLVISGSTSNGKGREKKHDSQTIDTNSIENLEFTLTSYGTCRVNETCLCWTEAVCSVKAKIGMENAKVFSFDHYVDVNSDQQISFFFSQLLITLNQMLNCQRRGSHLFHEN